MSTSTSHRLTLLKPVIMDKWVQRALNEVAAAMHQEDLALRNSLPEYLDQLADALSVTIDRTEARKQFDKEASTRVGKKHGMERAGSFNYSMDQVIFEYHILRQVVCDALEEEEPLTPIEREIIVCSVEQAVNDAATEYSDTLKEIQENLTRTLAHDLRSPLTVAKLHLQLMLRRPEDTEYVINKASSASLGLERLDRMIMDLLDASRMKAGGQLHLEFKENTDLNWIIKEVAGDLNLSNENKIVTKIKGKCLGTWNENGLRRVVENLVNNAMKYGAPHAQVTISIEEKENVVELSVHNEGEPIPKEEVAILFQQFRRSRKTEKKIGWGLGLTVVKGVVEAHHGVIKVQSEKGAGTTFIIELPKIPGPTV